MTITCFHHHWRDTSLGQAFALIIFWWLWPVFQGQHRTNTCVVKFISNSLTVSCVQEISWISQNICNKQFDMPYSRLDFGDLELNLKVSTGQNVSNLPKIYLQDISWPGLQIFIKLAGIYQRNSFYTWLNFGDHDPIFKVNTRQTVSNFHQIYVAVVGGKRGA